MTEDELSNMELTIMEIITQHRDVHFLNIMAQIKEMTVVTGQTFDKELFEKSLNTLEKKGLIKRLVSNLETFIITEKGRELL